ncbi:MAG TPA: S41 family peptidase [Flavisolibacter sp.]|nr:S41 family peptidase [Flavisolibacter sp.]
MKFLLVIGLLLVFRNISAQDCSCEAQLNFVINYFEQNNPAFQKIKNDSYSYKIYKASLPRIKAAAKKEKDADLCIRYLDQYVHLLKDHHSGIGFNLKRKDLSTAELITDFKGSKEYQQFRKISIDTTELLSKLSTYNKEAIEGIYSDGRSIVFGVIGDKKTPNKYIGVILKGNKLMDVGHVLLDITRMPDSSFDVYYNIGLLGFNFQRIFKNMTIANGQMPDIGFFKGANHIANGREYAFREINDSTNYLKLKSFDYRLKKELDSFYLTIDQHIRSKPYLIIDIRDNGGGSESAYMKLLQYAYTKPLQIDPADVWVSTENIKRYEESSSGDYKDLRERMKKAKLYTFIPQAEEAQDSWIMDSVTLFPKKIALLYNKGTASAAEGMIQYFIQSDKVITIGENSGGYIGYGNVMNAVVPCERFTVQSTTTRYLQKSKYEFVGIPPMFKGPKYQDWIPYAADLLIR